MSHAAAVTGELHDPVAQQALGTVNQLRRTSGLPPLQAHPLLSLAATRQSEERAAQGMMQGALEIGERAAGLGYWHNGISELVLAGPPDAASAMAFLLNDGQLRRDILRPDYREVGIGYGVRSPRSLRGDGQAIYWSVILAAPVPPLPAPNALTKAVLAAVNRHRGAHGRSPVAADPTLHAVAARHAADMARNGPVAASRIETVLQRWHTGSDGSDVAQRVSRGGYAFATVAENLAVGSVTAESVVEEWIKSPGHNHNLLRPEVTVMAVAAVDSAQPARGYTARWWCQILAAPDGRRSSRRS